MMRARFLGSIACGALLAFGGCTSTGVGNPSVTSLQLAIVNDPVASGGNSDQGAAGATATTADAAAGAAGADGTVGAAGAAGADASESLPEGAIEHAVVVIGEVRFLPCDLANGAEFVAPGPFVVNLIDKTTTPELPVIEGTPGGYCGIDAPLAPAQAPAALAGRSVFFDGHRSDGTFFLVYADVTATLRLRATPGAVWHSAEKPPLFFWAMRPRRWLVPSELDNADTTPDPIHQRAVIIDANRHPALFLAIRMRLAGVSTLYADANGDGIFDDGDRDAIVGQGVDDAN